MKLFTKFAGVVGTGLAVASANLYAAVPASVTAAIGGIQDDFDTVYDAAIPVMIAIVGALVVWKYGKKLALKV